MDAVQMLSRLSFFYLEINGLKITLEIKAASTVLEKSKKKNLPFQALESNR
jgi:hypothetical protein